MAEIIIPGLLVVLLVSMNYSLVLVRNRKDKEVHALLINIAGLLAYRLALIFEVLTDSQHFLYMSGTDLAVVGILAHLLYGVYTLTKIIEKYYDTQ